MWVFKIGGSLATAPQLRDWARLLAAAGAGRVVIVPGGGPFAAQVRRMQRRWDLDEVCAHHMALAAMDQYGLLLAGLAPGLTAAHDPQALRATLAGGGVPVWLPARCAGADAGIAASWAVASDSLAAWLAGVLGAAHLVLVKSVAINDPCVPASVLAGRGTVDAAFPRYRAGLEARCMLVHRAAPERAGRLLAGEPEPVTLIE